ncbi:MAG: nickel pincer cofactor biosynthesis protein LarC [Nitrospirota bacterium]
MKIAYLDCSSGISGDMCLGALVDAGVSLKRLEGELKKIPLKGYRLSAKKVKRAGIASTKVEVTTLNFEVLTSKKWEDIEKIIKTSSLHRDIKQKGLKTFEELFRAEAKVHGEGFHQVHLHELGGVDCIIDIFGTIIGLDILEIERVYSSPVNLGSGFVRTERGTLPVPAPATAEILKGTPVYSTDISFELTTPTGAAILKGLSSDFGSIPLMNIEKIGLGAGNKDFKDSPNVLRLLIGNPLSSPFAKGGMGGFLDEKVSVIETNIDDMNPQIFEYVMERLLKAGALDVFLTQVLMKKGRPGIVLTVLCNETRREDLMKIVLEETSTTGLRFYEARRRVLKREIKKIDTEFGKVKVKFSMLGNKILKATPEYEDCKRIAKKFDIPLIDVIKKIKPN